MAAIPQHTLETIRSFQKHNPKVLLCGSAALILSGLLPHREMHDIDFILNRKYFKESKLWMKTTPYSEQEEDGYTSYLMRSMSVEINLLIFEDNIILKSEEVIPYKGSKSIICQNLNDIISWKEKYNRPKDIRDLDAITSKAFEEAVFTEES